ncbi:MAG: pyrroline-5-carboxylate reductase [Clostridia bacterium]|nr:pyrroline-5-carboxylate reductase [Clostridia bacterium]
MKFGFIGTGNMGGALAEAVAEKTNGTDILVSNRTAEKAQDLSKKIGAQVSDNETIARKCKYVFLGVKPQMMAQMLENISAILTSRRDDVVLVSMAAGLSCEKISSMAGGGMKVIRIMPNTPVSIGKGIILYCANDRVSADELKEVADSLSPAGLVDLIDESLIDGASAVSGCGPAFVYIFAEALADGAVACGLPRKKAALYAAKMIEGSAALMSESNKHTGELKDAVCSPGGSTIQGVKALEKGGFRSCAINAVAAAYEKTLDLGK